MGGIDWTTATGLLALMSLPRVGPATALAVARGERDVSDLGDASERYEQASEQVRAVQGRDVTVLGFFDDCFPARLRDIPAPPAVVYIRGDLAAFEGPALAVVGTRAPTSFGVSATRQLTTAAAERGITIVSGLALGVDGLAHEAALAAAARTIAVLGNGIDRVAPRQRSELAERIVGSGGALLSEQPPGTAPSAHTLVARNRLQAGLADALLVGQTDLRGGTMHTVRFAAEQRRQVWCPVPHASSAKSAGLRALLETPATALASVLPAWKGYERLASRLGPAPLARPVTADSVAAWLAELTGPVAARSAQLSLDTPQ